MVTIKLKGREIPLLYTSYEVKTVQEEVGPIYRVIRLVAGRNPDDESDMSMFGGAEHVEVLGKMIKILGNTGLEESGQEADLTEKKVLRALKPSQLPEAIDAVSNALVEGMKSEIPEKEEEGPVDVTLEKMKKKETKES